MASAATHVPGVLAGLRATDNPEARRRLVNANEPGGFTHRDSALTGSAEPPLFSGTRTGQCYRRSVACSLSQRLQPHPGEGRGDGERDTTSAEVGDTKLSHRPRRGAAFGTATGDIDTAINATLRLEDNRSCNFIIDQSPTGLAIIVRPRERRACGARRAPGVRADIEDLCRKQCLCMGLR